MRALFAAWADRLAVRRAPNDRRGVMVGGRGVKLADESGVLDHDLFVCVDMDAGKRGERAEALVRQASAVERDWIDDHLIHVETHVAFDAQRSRVTATKRTLYGDLILEEVQAALPEGEQVARVLAEAASSDLHRALPLTDPDNEAFLARVRCLRAWLPELELPSFDDDELRALLPEISDGCRSFDDLRKQDLIAFLRAKLTHAQRTALDRDAPEKLQVPSGSWIKLQYEPGRAPVLAARIQELFGLAETPSIARGRIRVLMHLLAPNHRPQQVTDDLKSFWNGAYFEVRKDLKRRYPRHAWPEDPWNAVPHRKR